MLLYDLTFPRKDICGEQELYFRGGTLRGDSVYVNNGGRVTFDTYFNCFSHSRYKKYTTVKEVAFRLDVDGSGVLSLYRFADGADSLIVSSQIDSGGEVRADINSIPDGGFVYAAFEACGDAVIKSGGWYANGVAAGDVRIGIVICTYKREQYLRRNIANLTEYRRSLNDNCFFDVLVVDNGRTLTDDFGDGIRLIPNENTGGSGGFTRGIAEVCATGEYTHFLLMDDDILFDVNTLNRTATLLSVLADEYKDASVGGAMLVLDKPYFQEEMGADWTGNSICSRRRKLDARLRETICGNEDQDEPDYNAWFYMCMPVSAMEKYGYPLPLFIRCDDVEYGLRAAQHVITSSGIAVWHESFDNKYSAALEYYTKRNELIVSARYPRGKGAFANWIKLVAAVGKQLVQQRYFAVNLIFKAYADFFKGPQYLANMNSEKSHAEISSLGPRLLDVDELKNEFDIDVDLNQINCVTQRKIRAKNVLTLNGYFLPKCFYKKGVAQVDMAARFELDSFYLKKRVLHFCPATGKGFVTDIKKSELWKAGFRLIGYFFKMMFAYRTAAKKYSKFEFIPRYDTRH